MSSPRWIAAPAVALATALLLSACSNSATTSGATATSPASSAGSPAAAGHGGAPGHGGIPSVTGSSTGSPSAAAVQHNAQDVTFAREMIPHHASAIAMAKLAQQQAGGPEVKALAGRIEEAQGPEIAEMSGWLRSWNEPVPDATDPMDHSGAGGHTAGMGPAEMQKLMAARGATFDRMFLTMMIRHHQDAVDMSEREQARGQFAPAKELARSIAESQTKEIEEMRQLLPRL